MAMNLQSKTIVVTGVASGIGAEVARLARFHGAKVIGVDRTPVQMTLHGFHQADLGDPASIDALVKALPDQIDALANIAGVPGTAPLDVVARVNYLGLRHLTPGAAAAHRVGRFHHQCGLDPGCRMAAASGPAQAAGGNRQLRKRQCVAGGASGGARHLLPILQRGLDRVDLAAIAALVCRPRRAREQRISGPGVHPDPGRFCFHARRGTGQGRPQAHDPPGVCR
ncbi:hypothetical protein XFF6970_240050 [Xanthomonas citri pv. fuscans]|nr:hypothetical protein XFF6960_100049 [Xanthomonas citri pv. fuscans]SOO08582.1 hypothetical protein XFF6970_240050 [Xanthomonas citri pv. fuscans]SOO14652.1 hypothetical protein XFF7766_340013 [Xanthomonas citri pv. fuscans]